ncbi:DUF1697 domain-containing protein, partial [Micrococcus sp. SIMBA_131]
LEDDPAPEAAAALAALGHGDDRPAGPDRTDLEGRLLRMRCAAGVADSPLTPARLARALRVPGTARNPTSVRVLAGLPSADCPRRPA